MPAATRGHIASIYIYRRQQQIRTCIAYMPCPSRESFAKINYFLIYMKNSQVRAYMIFEYT